MRTSAAVSHPKDAGSATFSEPSLTRLLEKPTRKKPSLDCSGPQLKFCVVRFGEIELITEVKRELTNATAADLEQCYLSQVAQYSDAGELFSQLLVLDLTDHSGGVQLLEDLAWATERRGTPEATPQHVIVALIIGNPSHTSIHQSCVHPTTVSQVSRR